MKHERLYNKKQFAWKPKILLVDDDLISIKPVNYILQEMGCEVDLGFCGQDLVDQMVRKNFDLVILDWKLSDMYGWQAIDLLKHERKFITRISRKYANPLPVITYSVLEANQVAFEETQEISHYDHWQKPVSFYEISSRVSYALQKIALISA